MTPEGSLLVKIMRSPSGESDGLINRAPGKSCAVTMARSAPSWERTHTSEIPERSVTQAMLFRFPAQAALFSWRPVLTRVLIDPSCIDKETTSELPVYWLKRMLFPSGAIRGEDSSTIPLVIAVNLSDPISAIQRWLGASVCFAMESTTWRLSGIHPKVGGSLMSAICGRTVRGAWPPPG